MAMIHIYENKYCNEAMRKKVLFLIDKIIEKSE